MTLLRAFIAIDLPKQLQDPLEKQTTRLRQSLGDDLIRWVAVQTMHLTLKFIGTISTSHLDFIKQLLSRTAESYPQFDLQIGGVGCFPSPKQPRVLWAGLHARSDLVSLQKSIEAGITRLGYEKEERSFSPHLTLGRVRPNIDQAGIQKIRTTLGTIQFGSIGSAKADSLHLYKSELHSSGSVYTKLFSAPLNKIK